MPSWKKIIVSGSDASLNSLYAPSITGSLQGTASFATTASYAVNGGVTQLFAGPNITLAPTTGVGQVTISSTGTGTYYNTSTGSYGSFYDTTTQLNPVANIPRSMSLNTTDITNGVSVSGSSSPFNTYLKIENAGVYNIQFSAQLIKTDSGTDYVDIWLRRNGVDLLDSATNVTLIGNNDRQVAAWNWFATAGAGDYYQIMWASADTNTQLLAESATGVHPGIPSVIVTANRIDTFLSNTGSFSGSFNGVLNGTASYATQAATASYVVLAQTASFVTTAETASYVNPLNQAVNISGSLNLTGSIAITGSTATDLVRITQTGTGNAFVVEDSTNPDATPFRIDANGQTMLGTTTAYGPLTVRGNGATGVTMDVDGNAGSEWQSTRLFFKITGSASGLDTSIRNVSGSFLFSTLATANGSSGTTAMTISASGNVGIGTSPGASLHVFRTADPNLMIVERNAEANAPVRYKNTIGSMYAGLSTSASFAVGTSTDLMNASTTFLTVSASGNVGIGITTPSAKLHINNTTTGNSFLVEDSTNPDSTPFIIDAAGNIGIGTTSPTAKLTVQTSGSDDNLNAMIANFGKSSLSTAYGSTFIRVARYTTTTTQGAGDYTDIDHNSAGQTPHRYGTFGDTNIINGNRSTNGPYGNINFVTSGSTRMTVAGGTSAGNVGIGTTNPLASLHTTGSVIVANSMVIGSSSLGPFENTLTLGARDAVQEGGQIGFNAAGGTYTSASFIDLYQNRLRILNGTNATSTGEVANWNMHNLQMALPAYTSVSAFPGTAAANLAVDTSGNIITVSTTGGTVFPYVGNAIITGSLSVTGITQGSYSNTVLIDTASGQLYYTASSAIGGGASTNIGNSDLTITNNTTRVLSHSGTSRFIISGSTSSNMIELTNTTTGNTRVLRMQQQLNGEFDRHAVRNFTAAGNNGDDTRHNRWMSDHIAEFVSGSAVAINRLRGWKWSYYTADPSPIYKDILLISTSNEATLNASLTVTGSTYLTGTTQGSYGNVILIDTASGQLYYTASSAIGGGDAFPYTGSAQITGSLTVTGSIYGTELVSVESNDGANAILQKVAYTNTTGIDYTPAITKYYPRDVSYTARGSNSLSYNQLVAGNVLNAREHWGYDGIQYGIGFHEYTMALDTWDNASHPTVWRLQVTPSGSTTLVQRMEIDETGGLNIDSTQIVLNGPTYISDTLNVTGLLNNTGSNHLVYYDNITGAVSYATASTTSGTTTTTTTANIGSTTIYSVSTSSYDGAWFEYTARSGSNARAGQLMSIWQGSAVNFTETTTTDFGSTSGLSLGVYIVNGAMALTASADTNGWNIKTIVRSI